VFDDRAERFYNYIEKDPDGSGRRDLLELSGEERHGLRQLDVFHRGGLGGAGGPEFGGASGGLPFP
jgi:hypothetical protein